MTRPQIERAELAGKLKVSKSAVGEWCRGKSRPTVENMEKLAKEGIIPAGEWFEEAEEVAT